MSKTKYIAAAAGALMFLSAGAPVSASSLTSAQISAIVSLLQSFGADQNTINSVTQALGGSSVPSSTSCLTLSYNLYAGLTDSSTSNQVSQLQQFLGVSSITGYFGPMTQQAVQSWQSSHDIVSSGSPDTTGYGFVGPATRAAMACSGQTTPPQTSTGGTSTTSTTSTTAAYLLQHGLLVLNQISTPGTPISKALIFTIRADGTDKHVLTSTGSQYPSWTPDGRIIFVSNRSGLSQIWIMNEDGSNPRQIGDISRITSHISDTSGGQIQRVQMAKNGLIAFLHQGDGIWIMQSDGSNLRELVTFQLANGDAPSLAPSGTWLTFTQDGYGTPGEREIWRMNIDGTGLKQLTFSTDSDYPDANASSISPDENTVAIYTGVESKPNDTPLTWGHRNIGLVSAKGGPRTLLTICQPITTLQNLDNADPRPCITSDNPLWSPDGHWLIYDRGSPNAAGNGIYAIDIHGNNMMRLLGGGIGEEMVPLKYLP